MSNLKMVTSQERMEFIGKIRKPIIDPLISDWKSHEMTLEEFIGHAFISGMLFENKKLKEIKNDKQ